MIEVERARASATPPAARTRPATGYTATTVGAIAEAASVSPATIYKTYGGKSGLVRTLCLRALAGDGPVPAEDRSDALRAAGDARVLIDGWGRLVTEVSPRISPPASPPA